MKRMRKKTDEEDEEEGRERERRGSIGTRDVIDRRRKKSNIA